jgi:hypothetical protein
MSTKLCNLFEPCESPEAPLCPLQIESIAHGIWYGNEPICHSKKFQEIPWLKKQKKIAKLRLTEDAGYFTIRMLDNLHTKAITSKLKGADSNSLEPEEEWLRNQKRSQYQIKSPQNNRTPKHAKHKIGTIPLFSL